MASHRYDDGLEAASHNFPEVVPPQTHAYHAQQHHRYPEAYHDSAPIPKQTPSPYSPSQPSPGYGGATTIADSTIGSQAHVEDDHTTPKRDGKRRAIGGCSLLTFVLSCIIALLSAAVIGLAAGTGIEAKRANDAANKYAACTWANPVQTATSTFSGETWTTAATMTSTGGIGSPTSVSGVEVDSGCGSRAGQVNGTTYTSRKSSGINLAAIFTADFEACMDACASWTKYVVPKSDSKDPSWNCEAVSFIPAWVNRANAGSYTGNCYLKAGPVSIDKLTKNSNVHAALLQRG